jgi:hypothetical protein
MTIETVTKPEVPYTEAPASWNVSYVTPDGFICRITLRGESGRDLLEKAGNALTYLLDHDCIPDQKYNRSTSSETKQCPIHKCDMRKFEKDGKTWWSHKAEDNSWCNGKRKVGEQLHEYAAHLNFTPCLHRHVVVESRGGRYFSEGEVSDDIRDVLVCLDCFETLTEAEAYAYMRDISLFSVKVEDTDL